MIRDTFLSLSTRGLVIASGLLTSILTARGLGVSGRGEYFFIITLAALATQFGNLGLASSNTYSLAKDASLLERLTANSFWVAVVSGAILASGLVITLDTGDGDGWGGCQWYLLLLVPCMLYGQLGSNLLIGMSLIQQYNFYLLLSTSLHLLALAIAALANSNVSGFIAASAFASLLSASILMWMLGRMQTLKWRFNWEVFSRYFSYGLRAYMAAFFAFGVSRVAVLLLEAFWNSEAVGIYSIALQFADVLIILPSTVAMILFPDLLKGAARNRYARSVRSALYIGLLMAFLCLVLAILAPWLIEVLFGESFRPAATVLRWMLPGMICLSITTILSQYLATRGIPKLNIIIWLGGLIFLIMSAIYVIPVWGGAGAAACLSLTYALVLIAISSLAFKQHQKESRMDYQEV